VSPPHSAAPGGGCGDGDAAAGATAAADCETRAVVSDGGEERGAAELAVAATTQGEHDFISLECRTQRNAGPGAVGCAAPRGPVQCLFAGYCY
jgi:hypothetical protein